MRFFTAVMAVIVFTACSGTPEATNPKYEFLEIREVMNDDPLATPFEAPDGSEVRLGDRIISGSQAGTLRMKQNDRGSYDMLVSLTGAVQARWRRFASSRKPRDAGLLVEGRLLSVFTPEKPDNTVDQEVYTFAIPDVAADLDESEALNEVFDRNARKKDINGEAK